MSYLFNLLNVVKTLFKLYEKLKNVRVNEMHRTFTIFLNKYGKLEFDLSVYIYVSVVKYINTIF